MLTNDVVLALWWPHCPKCDRCAMFLVNWAMYRILYGNCHAYVWSPFHHFWLWNPWLLTFRYELVENGASIRFSDASHLNIVLLMQYAFTSRLTHYDIIAQNVLFWSRTDIFTKYIMICTKRDHDPKKIVCL